MVEAVGSIMLVFGGAPQPLLLLDSGVRMNEVRSVQQRFAAHHLSPWSHCCGCAVLHALLSWDHCGCTAGLTGCTVCARAGSWASLFVVELGFVCKQQ